MEKTYYIVANCGDISAVFDNIDDANDHKAFLDEKAWNGAINDLGYDKDDIADKQYNDIACEASQDPNYVFKADLSECESGDEVTAIEVEDRADELTFSYDEIIESYKNKK